MNIICNRIICPDGTELVSKHRHDYVSHRQEDGRHYAVDGGLDYCKRSYSSDDYTEATLLDDEPHEVIRAHMYFYNQDSDPAWKVLADMSDDEVVAISKQSEQVRPEYVRNILQTELEFRDE